MKKASVFKTGLRHTSQNARLAFCFPPPTCRSVRRNYPSCFKPPGDCWAFVYAWAWSTRDYLFFKRGFTRRRGDAEGTSFNAETPRAPSKILRAFARNSTSPRPSAPSAPLRALRALRVSASPRAHSWRSPSRKAGPVFPGQPCALRAEEEPRGAIAYRMARADQLDPTARDSYFPPNPRLPR
jgi:hypothetical protein